MKLLELKPKGGWENDESEQEAAARETYEEGWYFGNLFLIHLNGYIYVFVCLKKKNLTKQNSIWIAGAIGQVTNRIGIWKHHVTEKKEFSFFEMQVDKLEDKWPEMDERDRRWVCLFFVFF